MTHFRSWLLFTASYGAILPAISPMSSDTYRDAMIYAAKQLGIAG